MQEIVEKNVNPLERMRMRTTMTMKMALLMVVLCRRLLRRFGLVFCC